MPNYDDELLLSSDFGFTYPLDLVRRLAVEYDNGFLPEPGGALQQDALLMADIHLYRSLKIEAEEEIRRSRRG